MYQYILLHCVTTMHIPWPAHQWHQGLWVEGTRTVVFCWRCAGMDRETAVCVLHRNNQTSADLTECIYHKHNTLKNMEFHNNNTTTTTVLRHFFRDHPGDMVPEENFWTLWCKGRLTEADTPTIRMGTTPSGLTSAHLHHPPYFFTGRMPSCRPTNSVKALKATTAFGLGRRR